MEEQEEAKGRDAASFVRYVQKRLPSGNVRVCGSTVRFGWQTEQPVYRATD